MSKKGFLSTATLYSFFLVFCLLLVLIMSTYINNRINYKMLKSDSKKQALTNSKLKVRYNSAKNPVIYDGQEPVTPDNPSPSPEPGNPDTPAFSIEGYKTILINNGGGNTTYDSAINYIKGKSTPTFSKVATTNEGMFVANDNQGTSYYFRGAVDNNWVKYGKNSSNKDMYWRIIRINGDNSIRMIYSGTTAPTNTTKTTLTGNGTSIGKSAYNASTTGAEYVGYMYQANYQRGNATDSTIKSNVDSWFAGTSLKNDSNVVDNIFCNDRATNSTWQSSPRTTMNYNAYYRSNNPTLTCENKQDNFTTTNYGNGALKYPVGLISADEVTLAGGYLKTTNTKYYLYNGLSYYTMTPYYVKRGPKAYVYSVNNSTLSYSQTSLNYYIRPVINLNGNVKLSGTGTYDNVYEVVE